MKTALCLCFGVISAHAATPHYFLTTAAGTTPSLSAPIALDQPHVAALVAYDHDGNLYYTDGGNGHVWRLNANGTDTLIAGSYSSSATFVEGAPATDAALGVIDDFKFDSRGNLYIASGDDKVYKVTPDGTVHTFAGTGPIFTPILAPPATGPNIPAVQVPLSPLALAIDSEDNVYVQISLADKAVPGCSAFLSFPPDGSSSAIVATAVPCQDTIFTGPIPEVMAVDSTMAISGNQIYVTLTNVSYSISLPGNSSQQPATIPSNIGYAIATASDGSIVFFTSSGLAEVNPKNWIVDPLPNSSGVPAGRSLAVNPITGDVAFVSGNVVSVSSVSSGKIQAVACDAPLFGGDGGPATLAILRTAFGLAADSQGDLYVSDRDNGRIRKIDSSGNIGTIAGTGAAAISGQTGSALQAAITPRDLAMDAAGNLYFINAVSPGNEICRIDTAGRISTVVGGGSGKLMAGASATSVSISATSLAVDSGGDIFFSSGSIVYEVISGTISLVAGTGTESTIAPPAPAAGAGLGSVSSLAVDKSGNVYIGDASHTSIWKVDAQGNLNLVAGNNEITEHAVETLLGAGPAVGVNIGEPDDMVVDSAGNVYFSTLTAEEQVLVVDASGNLTPIGGGGRQSFPPVSSGDGGDAEQGTFSVILGMTMNGSGDLFVSDGNLIREMSPYNPASPPPFVSLGGVVGAGGSLPAVQAVSPGGEVSIFGANFVSAANEHTLNASDLVNGKIPTTLAGVCASFGGSPAAMLGVYPNQLNVQVGALTPGAVNVQVTTNCGTPQAVTSNFSGVVVQTASPEFYSFKPDPIGGVNPIAAVNALTGAFIGPPNLLPGATFVAAKAGDIVQAYSTGFGATSPAYGLGVIPGAAGTLTNQYSLTLGGVPIPQANLSYAGISPCCAGFYQLDFTVPPGIPSGPQPLVITIAGQPSPPEAYIQVQ